MNEILQIAAFWLVVIVVVRIAVCFPGTLLARILFCRLDAVRLPREPQASFLLRRARVAAGWVAQCAGVALAGYASARVDASLDDSLPFVVLWAVVAPFVGAGWLASALVALAQYAGVRLRDRSHAALSS